jgi:hypothetical protein
VSTGIIEVRTCNQNKKDALQRNSQNTVITRQKRYVEERNNRRILYIRHREHKCRKQEESGRVKKCQEEDSTYERVRMYCTL